MSPGDVSKLKKAGSYALCVLVAVGINDLWRFYATYHRLPHVFGSGVSGPTPDPGDSPQTGRFFFHLENASGQTAIYRMNTITGKIDLVVIDGSKTATLKIMDAADGTSYTSNLSPVSPVFVKQPDGTFAPAKN